MKGYQTALIAAGGAAALLAAYPLVFWLEIKRLEKPKYTVIRSIGTQKHWLTGKPIAEIRRYAPFMVAEVVVSETNMKEALSAGFRQVAKYIFGENVSSTAAAAAAPETLATPLVAEASETIAMTSPVAAQPTTDGSWKVSFMMPSKYTQSNIPKPKNPNVQLKEMPERTVAAISFYGNLPNQTVMDTWRDKLLSTLQGEGVEFEGEPLLYQYYPPWAPGFIRLNEVLYLVKNPAE